MSYVHHCEPAAFYTFRSDEITNWIVRTDNALRFASFAPVATSIATSKAQK
jgi:hypothetical protein